MRRTTIWIHAVIEQFAILILYASTAHSEAPPCQSVFVGDRPPAVLAAAVDRDTYLLCNSGYADLVSGVTRGPIWSAEHLTDADLLSAANMPRAGEFHPENSLPADEGAQLADYKRSGYDRGHMTPSGDMPNYDAQAESFSLANVVPQTPALNRGIWERVEEEARYLARRDGEVYVVTGPAYHAAVIQTIGPEAVPVPTSTWKAIYDPNARLAAAYVCKNTIAPTCAIVPIIAIIQVVGVDPFPALTSAQERLMLNLPSVDAKKIKHSTE